MMSANQGFQYQQPMAQTGQAPQANFQYANYGAQPQFAGYDPQAYYGQTYDYNQAAMAAAGGAGGVANPGHAVAQNAVSVAYSQAPSVSQSYGGYEAQGQMSYGHHQQAQQQQQHQQQQATGALMQGGQQQQPQGVPPVLPQQVAAAAAAAAAAGGHAQAGAQQAAAVFQSSISAYSMAAMQHQQQVGQHATGVPPPPTGPPPPPSGAAGHGGHPGQLAGHPMAGATGGLDFQTAYNAQQAAMSLQWNQPPPPPQPGAASGGVPAAMMAAAAAGQQHHHMAAMLAAAGGPQFQHHAAAAAAAAAAQQQQALAAVSRNPLMAGASGILGGGGAGGIRPLTARMPSTRGRGGSGLGLSGDLRQSIQQQQHGGRQYVSRLGDNNTGGNNMDPEAERPDTVLIEGLTPEQATHELLLTQFQNAGQVRLNDKSGMPMIWIFKQQGQPTGRALVSYTESASAQNAIQMFNGQGGLTVRLGKNSERPVITQPGGGGSVGGQQRGMLSTGLSSRLGPSSNGGGGGGAGGKMRGGRPGIQQLSGGGGGGRRTGEPDWICPGCRNRNYSWRDACNRCSLSKPDNPETVTVSSGGGGGGTGASGLGGGRGGGRGGGISSLGGLGGGRGGGGLGGSGGGARFMPY